MRLFAGSSKHFIDLNYQNQLADHLKKEFFNQLGYNPSQNEVMSWKNSLLRMAVLLDKNSLFDQGIVVEHQLPNTSKRLDVLICGSDSENNKQAIIVELKQWDTCQLSEYDSNYVVTWVGGGNRNILHPSVQVGNYKYYLEYNQTAFYEEPGPVKLSACSYLHNYNLTENDVLLDSRFSKAVEKFPLFDAQDFTRLGTYITEKVGRGDGMEVLAKVEQSKARPSKKLLQQVSTVIKEKLSSSELNVFSRKDDYVLLDEQLVIYDNVVSLIKKGFSSSSKHAIIVKGGPGTGKSVVALKILADLAEQGLNAQFATGSRSFTETLRKIIKVNGNSLFKYFMSYGECQPNEIDVLVMDEAHRIREKTGYPFKGTGRPQVEDLIRAAKVSVFFIDDFQAVRVGEIGHSNYLKEHAKRLGCKVYEYELEAQFRCGGSDGYINWISNTLHISRTANALWSNEEDFEFKIFESPDILEKAILQKQEEGYSARVTAGFCWKWSDKLEEDQLVKDVQIGEYRRPWNARPETKKLPKGVPTSNFWAYDSNGIGQVGCIYTAQGFEFDYVGVIFGNDLRFNPDKNIWEGFPENSHDSQVKKSRENFLQLVKNTYRVLLSRGMKGCYVYFVDKETERFFRSRLSSNKSF